MTLYMLEVFSPGSAHDAAPALESDTPFQSIEVGHLVNVQSGGKVAQPIFGRVVQVEHILWTADDGGVRHKICVYTEAAENKAETRLKREP